MRKLILLAISGLVLLGVMGLEAQSAGAYMFTDCDGQPAGIRGLHIVTEPDTGGAIADLYGGGAACGQNFNLIGRKAVTKFFILSAGDMDSKAGSTVRCANPAHPETLQERQQRGYCEGEDLGPLNGENEGPFVGKTHIDLKICPLDICAGDDWAISWINVNKAAGTLFEPNPNDHCASVTVVQCFQGGDSLGTGVSDITVEPCWAKPLKACREAAQNISIDDLDPMGDRYLMTVYEVEPFIPGTVVYYQEIGEVSYRGHEFGEPDDEDMHVCARANLDPLARTCGTSDDDWVQKNGPAGQYSCGGGKPEGYAARAVLTKSRIPDACSVTRWT